MPELTGPAARTETDVTETETDIAFATSVSVTKASCARAGHGFCMKETGVAATKTDVAGPLFFPVSLQPLRKSMICSA